MKKSLLCSLIFGLFLFSACEKEAVISTSESMVESLANRSGENDCFEFIYPITVNMPDASTEIIADKEGWGIVKSWKSDDKKSDFSFQYPLNLLIEGVTTTVNNEDEMDEVGKDCFGDDKEEWGDDKDDDKDAKDKEDCFNHVYPLTVIMPDGTTIAIADKEGWNGVKSWYENHPDSKEDFSYEFPITVSFEGKDETLTLNNAAELEKLKKDCYGDDGKDKDDCLSLVYPVSYNMPDGSTIELNDDEDWKVIKTWFENHPDADKKGMALIYPVDVVFENGTARTVNNEDEMKKAKGDCK